MSGHVALDLALGTTGFAWPGGYDKKRCAGLTGTNRLRWWARELQSFYRLHMADEGIDTVVVGAPFMASQPERAGASLKLAKLHGVAEFLAGNLGLRYVEVQDVSARPAVIGKGAKKPDVLPWARSLGYPLGDSDGDVADALLFYVWWNDRELVRGRSAPVLGPGAA